MENLQKERDYLASLNEVSSEWYHDEVNLHTIYKSAKSIEADMKDLQKLVKSKPPIVGLIKPILEKVNGRLKEIRESMKKGA